MPNRWYDVGALVGGVAVGMDFQPGTYTGDGSDNRNIDIGVNLAGKSDVYIVIKAATGTNPATHRIEYGQGDLAMVYSASADMDNLIQGLTATGFEVGSSSYVNASDVLYRYVAFWKD